MMPLSTAASPAWYAVWTRSRHEQVVRQQLLQKNIETFLPTIARWSRWKDRRKKIGWPLFRATASRGSMPPIRCPSSSATAC